MHSVHMFWHEKRFNYSEKRTCIREIIERAKAEKIEVSGFQAFLTWDYWVHSLKEEALRLHDVRIWQIVHSYETVYLCSLVNFIIFGLMLVYKFFEKNIFDWGTFLSNFLCDSTIRRSYSAALIYPLFAIFFYWKVEYGTKKHLMEFEKKMVEQNWDTIKGQFKKVIV